MNQIIRNLQEPRNLHQPAYIVRIHIRINGPFGKLVPLVSALAVNTQPQFRILILRLFQIAGNLLYYVGEIFTVRIVICLEEDLPEPALADRIVFRVELVEPMEGIPISVHVQHVHGQIVRGQIHGLKNN